MRGPDHTSDEQNGQREAKQVIQTRGTIARDLGEGGYEARKTAEAVISYYEMCG